MDYPYHHSEELDTEHAEFDNAALHIVFMRPAKYDYPSDMHNSIMSGA